MPWEYGDIAADYVLGVTTCALFLSLKYHRLHPEYIYTRIKNLQGRYLLRIVLVMVDIQNHEESLKELSKTSIINNVTLILCWSAPEGARYLELFKTFENAAPTAIKQHQSSSYSDRMVQFITTPRSVNKTDAVSLVMQFGSVRTAVNARHEDISGIAGWGEKKVQRWCAAVREPFRNQHAARRGLAAGVFSSSQPVSRAPTISRDVTRAEGEGEGEGEATDVGAGGAEENQAATDASRISTADAPEVQQSEANREEPRETEPSSQANLSTPAASRKRKPETDPLNEGVMAALGKLRRPNS